MGQAASSDCHKDERREGPVLDPASTPSHHPLSATVALGGGCFWGVEHYMTRNFQNRFPGSVKSHRVGFMSPNPEPAKKNPTYKDVCSGKSGHVEVLMLELQDPHQHFEDLVRFFFGIHDSTTDNRQGADRGTQYQSVIFCADQEQKNIVAKVIKELQHLLDCGAIQCFAKRTVRTRTTDLSEFTPATERHQSYLIKNPNGYCNHFVRSRDRKPPRIQRKIKLHLPTAFVPSM